MRGRLPHTQQRARQKNKIKTRMGTGTCVQPPRVTLLNDTVTEYSISISYIDTYPLCDKKTCPVILHVVKAARTHGLIQDELGDTEDTMELSERVGHFHINLKPQSRYSDWQ